MSLDYICIDCGRKFLTKQQLNEDRISTFHFGKCDVCGERKSITHIRHYNYCRKPSKKTDTNQTKPT